MSYSHGIKPNSERIGEVKPGWWYAVCCEEDLYEVESVEQITELVELYNDEDEGWFAVDLHFWPTKAIALQDLTGVMSAHSS